MYSAPHSSPWHRPSWAMSLLSLLWEVRDVVVTTLKVCRPRPGRRGGRPRPGQLSRYSLLQLWHRFCTKLPPWPWGSGVSVLQGTASGCACLRFTPTCWRSRAFLVRRGAGRAAAAGHASCLSAQRALPLERGAALHTCEQVPNFCKLADVAGPEASCTAWWRVDEAGVFAVGPRGGVEIEPYIIF